MILPEELWVYTCLAYVSLSAVSKSASSFPSLLLAGPRLFGYSISFLPWYVIPKMLFLLVADALFSSRQLAYSAGHASTCPGDDAIATRTPRGYPNIHK